MYDDQEYWNGYADGKEVRTGDIVEWLMSMKTAETISLRLGGNILSPLAIQAILEETARELEERW